MVVLDDEIEDAITIDKIHLKRGPAGEDSTVLNDFKIYMGLCASDTLGMSYDENFVSGTRTLVYSASPFTAKAEIDEWFEIVLDSPYYYNYSDNLLIEVEWSSGMHSIYTWQWDGEWTRGLRGEYGASTANTPLADVPHLILEGELSLDSRTFGSIKAQF